MFANKGMFAEGEEVDIDVDALEIARQQNARPMLTRPESMGASAPPAWDRQPSQPGMSSPMSGGEDTPSTPTPAMRKQKMDEMRRAHLDKRKQKAMAAPAVLRANADQIKSPGGPAAAASPSSAGPSSPQPFNRQMSFGASAAAAAPSAARASYPGAGSFNGAASPLSSGHDSDDDEREGAVVDLDPHVSSLIANKRLQTASKHISQAERDMIDAGIAPVFDPVKPVSASVKLDYSDLRAFLLQPVPKGVLFQCYILRNKKGLLNKLYPTYECYVSGEERFLMAARKRTQNKTSNYMISTDKSNVGGGKESPAYLGKVRSNFVGTEFVAYDKGLNPGELEPEAASVSLLSVRQELGAVFYESNILGSKGPRKMTAVVPAVRKDGSRAVWKPLNPEQSVAVQYKRAPSSPDFLTLVNKTPKWNDVAGAYVLNFNGRVTQASVKNFQLISLEDPETVLLQFGRIGKDTFTMDLQYPLSPMQAFSIALTSFDYKFACE